MFHDQSMFLAIVYNSDSPNIYSGTVSDVFCGDLLLTILSFCLSILSSRSEAPHMKRSFNMVVVVVVNQEPTSPSVEDFATWRSRLRPLPT